MTVVADVVAKFTADVSGLQSSIQSVQGDLDKMGATSSSGVSDNFKEAGSSVDDFSSKTQAAGSVVGDLEERAGSLGNAVKSAMTGALGVAGIGGLLLVAKNATTELQTLGVQFNATFGGEGTSQLQQAVQYANQYGIAIGSAGSAWAQFGQATKGSSQNINADMKSIADIAAGTGTSVDQLSQSIGNYYQIIQRQGGEGGAASRYAQQLVTSHVITQDVANQLRIQANQGASPDQLLNTIISAGEQTYAGAGAAQSKTLGGELTTFKNQFSEASAGSLSPLMKDLQSGLAGLNSAMDSSSMKVFVRDIQNLVGAVAGGVAIVAPFAKEILGMAGAILNLVATVGPAKAVIEGLVAALIAMKAVDIVSSLAASAKGYFSESAAVTADTEAITANTAAKIANSTAGAEGAAGSVAGGLAGRLGAATGVGTDAAAAGSFTGILPLAVAGAGVVAGHYADQAAGGGSGGNIAKDALSGAGIGAAIGIIAPGIGNAAGAAVGAAIGATLGVGLAVFSNNVKAAADSAKQYADSVNGQIKADAGAAQASVRPGSDPLSSIMQQQAFSDSLLKKNSTTTGGGLFGADGVSITAPNKGKDGDAAQAQAKQADAASYNANKNVTLFQEMAPGMNKSDASTYLSNNGVDITKPMNQMYTAVEAAAVKVQQLGGAAQYSAEQLANKLGFQAAQIGGQYGESTIAAGGAKGGLTWDQFSGLAKQQGINLSDYGSSAAGAVNGTQSSGQINEQTFNTPSMTTGQAQLLNANISATQQYIDAQNSLVTAQHGVTQAGWSLTDAQHAVTQADWSAVQAGQSLTQAQWSLTQAGEAVTQAQWGQVQANFAAEQASMHLVAAQDAQTSSAASFTSALTSGYIPANAGVKASLDQIEAAANSAFGATPGLASAVVASVNQEVSAYNALEAQMNSTAAGVNNLNIAGDSLSQTYQQLSGNVQATQATMQGYQDILTSTLAGQKEMNQALQDEKLASAKVSGQEAELQLAGYSTSSPEYIALQRQAAIDSAKSQLTQANDTLGLGNQQFQISQAQLAPDASFEAMLQAAQGIGKLQGPLQAAKLSLDAVAPTYDKLNTQLTIQSQKNQAVTSSLAALAGADSGIITAQNSVTTSNQAVTSAGWGVVNANNAQTAAGWAVTNAQQGVTAAQWAQVDAANGLTAAHWHQTDAANAAVDATLALSVFGGASSCNIAIELGVTGPNSTNAMSCASGAIAVGNAFREIRHGYADVMIAGGAEAPLAPLCYGAFALIRAMSTRNDDPGTASRPFDQDRDGFVMGEGAAVLVLEERSRALARGAHIYAEILGFGTSSDAHHMTAPRPDGSQAARAIRLALREARIRPSDVDYVNAHGSSTPLNDSTESLAIREVLLTDRERPLPVSGTKGYYGHALGASGAIEAAICALSIDRKWLPPTVNLASPDVACNLDHIPSGGVATDIGVAVSNSFGFGGINAVLVFANGAR